MRPNDRNQRNSRTPTGGLKLINLRRLVQQES